MHAQLEPDCSIPTATVSWAGAVVREQVTLIPADEVTPRQ